MDHDAQMKKAEQLAQEYAAHEATRAEWKGIIDDLRNDRAVRSARNRDELGSLVKDLPDDQLKNLHESTDIGISATRTLTNMGTVAWAAMGAAGTALTVALAFPVARWRGMTQLGFKEFMKHPASLAVVALGSGEGIGEKYNMRHTLNEAETYHLAEAEMKERAQRPQETPDHHTREHTREGHIAEASMARNHTAAR
jgi:hypothetical protein